MNRFHRVTAFVVFLAVGCAQSRGETPPSRPATSAREGTSLIVRDTLITATFDAAGIAQPVQRSVLSTRLMGSITEVLVREGDLVKAGQVLARIDARDVEAKRAQVDAGIAAAEAVYRDAQTQAARFRALYADSAATRYQLEQTETGLVRAEAGLTTARASRTELDAVGAYATVRAPFSGIVTRRYVDPGAFAAPGAPVIELQDASRLRVSVSVPPRVAATLRRGQALEVRIEDRAAAGLVEGTVPAPSGSLYLVNALVENPKGEFLPGSSATLRVPDGTRSTILVPLNALVREGDLVGVRVQSPGGAERRWVKTGASLEDRVEILAGLKAGEVILLGGD